MGRVGVQMERDTLDALHTQTLLHTDGPELRILCAELAEALQAAREEVKALRAEGEFYRLAAKRNVALQQKGIAGLTELAVSPELEKMRAENTELKTQVEALDIKCRILEEKRAAEKNENKDNELGIRVKSEDVKTCVEKAEYINAKLETLFPNEVKNGRDFTQRNSKQLPTINDLDMCLNKIIEKVDRQLANNKERDLRMLQNQQYPMTNNISFGRIPLNTGNGAQYQNIFGGDMNGSNVL